MKKIFVSGASGFIGRKLCYALAQKGHAVHALCRDIYHPWLVPHPNIRFIQGDILNLKSLKEAMAGCNAVFHTAAMAKMWAKNTADFFDINVTGTQNVLQTAAELQVEKVVYTSTCGVLGPTVKYPMTENDPRITGFPIHYERTKFLADKVVKSYVSSGLDIVTVNPSRVYGEGPITDSNSVSRMISAYLQGRWRIIPGNGQNVANYVYIDDVVKGHIAALERGETGHRYILGGEDISFNQFFSTLESLSGTKNRLFHVPQRVIKAFSQVEKLKVSLTGLPPVFLPEFADRLLRDQKYSSQKAITKLHYSITPFTEGMQKTISYLINQPL